MISCEKTVSYESVQIMKDTFGIPPISSAENTFLVTTYTIHPPPIKVKSQPVLYNEAQQRGAKTVISQVTIDKLSRFRRFGARRRMADSWLNGRPERVSSILSTNEDAFPGLRDSGCKITTPNDNSHKCIPSSLRWPENQSGRGTRPKASILLA